MQMNWIEGDYVRRRLIYSGAKYENQKTRSFKVMYFWLDGK